MPRARYWLLVPLYVVVAAIGVAWGGRNTYRSLRDRAPAVATCTDLVAGRTDADWVRLDACVPVVTRIGVQRRVVNGTPAVDPEAVYVPLYADQAAADHERATLLLRVDHGPLLRLAARLPTEAEVQAIAEVFARPIDGLIERSIDRSERDREELRQLGIYLAEDFIVVDYDARPRPLWLALLVLAVGLGALALLVRTWQRRRRPADLPKAKLVAG
jgi:hypothetical protein